MRRTFIPLNLLVLSACPSPREAAPNGADAERPPAEVSATAVGPEDAPPPEPGKPSPDCDARKARIEARLEAANRCSADADCSVLMPGCPYGCWRPIHRSTDTASIEADIRAYNQSCAECAYRCRPLEQPPTCKAGRCSVE